MTSYSLSKSYLKKKKTLGSKQAGREGGRWEGKKGGKEEGMKEEGRAE